MPAIFTYTSLPSAYFYITIWVVRVVCHLAPLLRHIAFWFCHGVITTMWDLYARASLTTTLNIPANA
jgi:hypothetical protein